MLNSTLKNQFRKSDTISENAEKLPEVEENLKLCRQIKEKFPYKMYPEVTFLLYQFKSK